MVPSIQGNAEIKTRHSVLRSKDDTVVGQEVRARRGVQYPIQRGRNEGKSKESILEVLRPTLNPEECVGIKKETCIRWCPQWAGALLMAFH